MAILVWTEEHIAGGFRDRIAKVLTEVNDKGRILREIGLDEQGKVLYIAPALRGARRYGLFDLLVVDMSQTGPQDFPRAAFDELWAEGVLVFGERPGRTVS